MNKTTKTTIFMFSLLDYKAMEEYFEKMASQGWMLEKIGAWTVKFRKTDPQNLIFTVDLFPYLTAFDSPNNTGLKDYHDLCEQSGWHFVTSANKFQIFYANADENPTPIQTDSSVEEKIVRKSVFGIEFLVFLICLPALLFSFGGIFPFDYSKLFTNISILSTVYFPILILPIAIYTGYFFWWFWQAKRNIRQGLSLPRTSLRAARWRGMFLLGVGGLLISFMIIAAIADAINGYRFILLFLLLPASGLVIGIWFKKNVAAKERSRKKNLSIFTALILGSTIFLTVLITGLVLSSGKVFEGITGIESGLPEGYTALKLSDFGIKEPPKVLNFSERASFVVPVNYDYYEITNGKSIRTKYIKAASPGIARYIFDGMLQREGSLLYRTISQATGDDWDDVDQAYYLNDTKSLILLIKDEVVILLDGKIDFSQPEVRKICLDKLNLIR